AQEYQQVFPNSVNEVDGLLYLNSSNMIPYAIAGLKEMDSKVRELTRENQELKARNKEFEERIKALEKRTPK
ncbi:MAG: hypothetical protein HY591_01985, partial [Candidatus Omnitrophica bacterium]|nr:hypothetical protein [Candidatus Omnitrophota bacterium]